MNRTWFWTAGILTGLCLAVTPALPQAYTISAKPGVVNYIEGNISLNGQPVSPGELQSAALNAGDVLSVNTGKAEVLLTPGVFLRLGNNTQVHMISPSLVDTQLELQRGEAMIEVDQIVKDCRVSVLNHGASILIEKEGLYRLSADDAPRVGVIDGKAQVYLGDKKLDLGKGREVVLSELLKPEKFDPKKEDDLYAWSNVRSEYNASVSYQAARSAPANGYSAYSSGLGYGYGGGGWLWNAGFSSWAWLPGDGAFFSPFGWGFFSPGAVAYAPVVGVPAGWGHRQGRDPHNGGHGQGNVPHDGGSHHWRGHPGGRANASAGTPGTPGPSTLVPVNPNRPPAMGLTSSPWADHVARRDTARAASAIGGFRTSSGAPSPGFSAAQGAGSGGGHRAWSGSRPAGATGAGGGAYHGGGNSAYHGGGSGGGWHGGGGGAGGGGGYHGGGGGGGGYHGGGGAGGGGGGNGGGGHSAPGGAAGGTHGR